MRPKPVDPTNTDTPPACKPDCPYRQKFDGYDRQRNALRMETASLVQPERCGWNIKPGKFGGQLITTRCYSAVSTCSRFATRCSTDSGCMTKTLKKTEGGRYDRATSYMGLK